MTIQLCRGGELYLSSMKELVIFFLDASLHLGCLALWNYMDNPLVVDSLGLCRAMKMGEPSRAAPDKYFHAMGGLNLLGQEVRVLKMTSSLKFQIL